MNSLPATGAVAFSRSGLSRAGIAARELLMASRRMARCSRNRISIATRMIAASRIGLISR
jgi:hypothetical protein